MKWARATAPAPTSGITPRRCRIFFPRWNAACGKPSFSYRRIATGIRISARPCRLAPRPTLSTRRRTASLEASSKFIGTGGSAGTRIGCGSFGRRSGTAWGIASSIGTRPQRRSGRAAPQHLRHRILGAGRHVLQLLSRGTPGRGGNGPRFGRGYRRIRAAGRGGQETAGIGAVQRGIFHPEYSMERAACARSGLGLSSGY